MHPGGCEYEIGLGDVCLQADNAVTVRAYANIIICGRHCSIAAAAAAAASVDAVSVHTLPPHAAHKRRFVHGRSSIIWQPFLRTIRLGFLHSSVYK